MMQVVDLTRQLPTNGHYPERKVRDCEYVVLHHSATPNADRAGPPLRIRRIAEYHIGHNGWPGIGYHFCIDRAGIIYWCNELTAVSHHAAGANLHGVGICLLGTYTKEEPPEVQAKAAAWLVRFLALPLKEHRQFGGTVCPGMAGAAVRREMERV